MNIYLARYFIPHPFEPFIDLLDLPWTKKLCQITQDCSNSICKESCITRKVLGKYQKFTQKELGKYQQSTKKDLGKYLESSLKNWESTWSVLEKKWILKTWTVHWKYSKCIFKDCTSFGLEIGKYWIINTKVPGNYWIRNWQWEIRNLEEREYYLKKTKKRNKRFI